MEADLSGQGLDHAGIAEALLHFQRLAMKAENTYHDQIVQAKDEGGWTFREIGEVLGIAHSWTYKLYKRRKVATRARRKTHV